LRNKITRTYVLISTVNKNIAPQYVKTGMSNSQPEKKNK